MYLNVHIYTTKLFTQTKIHKANKVFVMLCLVAEQNGQKQGSKLRGAEGQNAPKLSPNAPRLLNLGAKFCCPIQPDICFEA